MTYTGVSTIQLPGVPANAANPLPWRDPTLKGVANSGVRFMFDLAFPWCYPGGAPAGRAAAGAPANGAVVQDMSGNANGSALVPGAGLAYAGGGFDFTNSNPGAGSGTDNGVVMPSSVLADIYAAYGGNAQQFLFCMYAKLPTLANWNASASVLAIAGDQSYAAAASLFEIDMKTGGTLEVRRQTAANAYDNTTGYVITPAAGDYGSVVQIAVWRNAAGQGFQMTSANGVNAQTRAAGSANTQNFGGNTFTVGRNGASFNGGGTGVLTALSGFRVYRGFLENLARSGRTPQAVLASDYAATVARGVFG